MTAVALLNHTGCQNKTMKLITFGSFPVFTMDGIKEAKNIWDMYVGYNYDYQTNMYQFANRKILPQLLENIEIEIDIVNFINQGDPVNPPTFVLFSFTL